MPYEWQNFPGRLIQRGTWTPHPSPVTESGKGRTGGVKPPELSIQENTVLTSPALLPSSNNIEAVGTTVLKVRSALKRMDEQEHFQKKIGLKAYSQSKWSRILHAFLSSFWPMMLKKSIAIFSMDFKISLDLASQSYVIYTKIHTIFKMFHISGSDDVILPR